MRLRSARAKGFTLALAAAAAAGMILFRQLGQRDATRLEQAQAEAQALIDAGSPDARKRHAAECIRLADPLIDKSGPIGSAAALLVLGAAPVAGIDAAEVVPPPAHDVERLPTRDLLQITTLMFHTRRFGPADQLLDVLLARSDANRESVLRLAAAVRFELGRDGDVLAHCDELIALHPDEPGPYRIKAMVHRNHGRWEHFVDTANEALARMQTADEVLRLEVIDAYLLLGQTPDARREFDLFAAHAPELVPQAPTVRARLLLQEGHLEQAEQLLREYLEAAPDDPEALVLLGTIHSGQERFADAATALQAAIDQTPGDEKAWYLLSQCYARLNDADQAREALERHRMLLDKKVQLHALEDQAAREPLNVAVRDELAAAYREIGMPDLGDFWERAARAAE